MLSFVRRKHQQRLTENWNRGLNAFHSLLNEATLRGPARPFIYPILRSVTVDTPFTGPYLEDDMTPALMPDGTPLETYMIDGYAIDNLWVGHDLMTCWKWLHSFPAINTRRILHPTHTVKVYPFTREMAEVLHHATRGRERFHGYAYCVDQGPHFQLFSEMDFYRNFRWERPKQATAHHPLRRAA